MIALPLGLARVATIALAVTSLALAASCGAPTRPTPLPPSRVGSCTAATARAHVTVETTSALRFNPSKVCLRVGGTVTWVNPAKDLDHTSTDEPQLAANPRDARTPPGAKGWNLRLPPGHSAKHAFHVAGIYRYFCIPHETLGMVGEVIVVR